MDSTIDLYPCHQMAAQVEAPGKAADRITSVVQLQNLTLITRTIFSLIITCRCTLHRQGSMAGRPTNHAQVEEAELVASIIQLSNLTLITLVFLQHKQTVGQRQPLSYSQVDEAKHIIFHV